MDFFTNTYDIKLTTHEGLKDNQRPVYEFRAATIKERREENKVSKWLSDIVKNPDEEVDDPLDFIERVLPLVERRLLCVRIGNKKRPKLLDLESSLDYTSIMELYMSMRRQEETKILEKKRLRLRSSLSLGESAKDATPENATDNQAERGRSSKLNAPNATETGVSNANK